MSLGGGEALYWQEKAYTLGSSFHPLLRRLASGSSFKQRVAGRKHRKHNATCNMQHALTTSITTLLYYCTRRFTHTLC